MNDFRPIIDAGPALNFFALNKERLLFSVTGALHVPEAVVDEVKNRAEKDSRFSQTLSVLPKLPDRLWATLSDQATPELATVMERIRRSQHGLSLDTGRDLGEFMVVSHAVLRAEAGAHVTAFVDDGKGQRLVEQEANRLKRLSAQGRCAGSLDLISTHTVLRSACEQSRFAHRGELKELYNKLRTLDDGLVPISDTGLLDLPCW